jgi:hypothetical protein
VLRLSGNKVYVVASKLNVAAGVDTVTPVENIYTQYGVTVTPSTDSIMLDQSGLGRNGATIVLSKSGRADTVTISQYGQILK